MAPSIAIDWPNWNWPNPNLHNNDSLVQHHQDVGSSLPNGIYHGNFVWYEDADDSPMLPNQPLPPLHHYIDLTPLLPFGMMLIISTIIFMLIIFRRWPGLVAGIVAGCLTSISIYLLLLTLKEQKLVYE